MDRKKELKLQYKLLKPEAGVYQIKNTKNGKALVDSMADLRSLNGRRMQLEAGMHSNKALQADWKAFGPEVFTFDVLEVLKEKEDPAFDAKKELEKLLKKWVEEVKSLY
jgi:hypothetical protein